MMNASIFTYRNTCIHTYIHIQEYIHIQNYMNANRYMEEAVTSDESGLLIGFDDIYGATQQHRSTGNPGQIGVNMN